MIPTKDCFILIDEFENLTNSAYTNLLTLIDGVNELNNVIIFICTNEENLHTSKCNNSLFRPGRVDMICEFGYCTKEQAEKLIELYYDQKLSIDETKLGNFYPSSIGNYFSKGYSIEELLKTILIENDENEEKEKNEENEKNPPIIESFPEKNKWNKKNKKNDFVNMSPREREIYIEIENINNELKILRMKEKITDNDFEKNEIGNKMNILKGKRYGLNYEKKRIKKLREEDEIKHSQ